MSINTIKAHEKWVTIGPGRLYAKCWESVPAGADALAPIVLFHDSLGSVELWREFPESLAQATGRTVIAYDRLGFGKSDPHPGALALSFVSDEAQTGFKVLREQLGFDTFIVFGHSVGGCMSVCVGADFPSCLGVVTESAQSFVEDRTRSGIIEAKAGFAKPGQLDRLKRYHGDKAQWVLDAWTETWLSPEFKNWNLDAELQRVRCPLLALHGSKDEYGSSVQPKRIADQAGGPSSMQLFENCGHLPHREIPEAVLSAVSQWIETVVAKNP